MDLKRLRYFCAIYEQGSISRASHVLHVSQPALSKRLQELEDEVCSSLFLRTNEGMLPTESGALLYRTARELVFKAEDIQHKLALLATGQKQRCHIGLSYLYRQYFTPLIMALQGAYRDLEFIVTVSDSSQLEFMLKNSLLDISLQQRAPGLPGVEAIELDDVPAVVVAHRNLTLPCSGDSITLDELGCLPLLLIKRINGVGTYEAILDGLLRKGRNPNIVMSISDSTSVLQYVATEMCAATVVPRSEITPFHSQRCRILQLVGAPSLYRPVIYRTGQAPCADILDQARQFLAAARVAEGISED